MNEQKQEMKRQRGGNSTKAIPLEHSVEMRVMYQIGGLRGEKLLKRFPQYSKAAIYKHAKKEINATTKSIEDKRHVLKGRNRTLTARDCRKILRAVIRLREIVGTFTLRKIQLEAGLNHLSNRTFRRYLNRVGYYYLRSRKKGLSTKNDIKKRMKFCRNVKNKYRLPLAFWKHNINFYLDGVGFVYKQNPMDEALAPAAREWRMINEGLDRMCTAKGKKEGSNQAKFMVAISYNHGVVMCRQYFGRISGRKFANIVDEEFPKAFRKCGNPRVKRFLQDGDPSQNSAIARKAIKKTGTMLFSIPPRSPDLNPIENFFHQVKVRLYEETRSRGITNESFEQYSLRVKNIIEKFEKVRINRLIESMPKRINIVLRSKGNRIKY